VLSEQIAMMMIFEGMLETTIPEGSIGMLEGRTVNEIMMFDENTEIFELMTEMMITDEITEKTARTETVASETGTTTSGSTGGTEIVMITIDEVIEMMTETITGGNFEIAETEMRTGTTIGGNSVTTATAQIEIEMM
jgi:hypothetical protein